jgi:hypothetical protein
MSLGLRAAGSALRQVFSRLALSVGGNVIAIALSLPIIALVLLLASFSPSLSYVPLGVAVLVGILPNPACMGLQAIAREMAQGESPDFKEFWQGLRAFWRIALNVWMVAAAVTAVCFLNVAFYANQAASSTSSLRGIAGPLSILWGLLLLAWLALHLYVAPLLQAQETPGVLLTYRNALVLTVSRPLTSWTVIPIWLALLVFTSVTGLVTIIGLALAAAIQQNALRAALANFPVRSE